MWDCLNGVGRSQMFGISNILGFRIMVCSSHINRPGRVSPNNDAAGFWAEVTGQGSKP